MSRENESKAFAYKRSLNDTDKGALTAQSNPPALEDHTPFLSAFCSELDDELNILFGSTGLIEEKLRKLSNPPPEKGQCGEDELKANNDTYACKFANQLQFLKEINNRLRNVIRHLDTIV